MRPRLRLFLLYYALCFAVQMAGGYFTSRGVVSWYPDLQRSPFNPPAYAFPIAWTLLYALMAWAAALVHQQAGGWRWKLHGWWLTQLLLGLLWCAVFFGYYHTGAGLVVLVVNLLAAIIMAVLFWSACKPAGWVLVPLIGWMTLATHLNLYIWRHN